MTAEPSDPPKVSVVILTFNEELSIESCLKSCSWCDDVHVLDSGSTDRTVDLATGFGVKIHFHKFESFAKQRNWAIDNISCRYDWVFHLDADEHFTPELVSEISAIAESRDQEHDGFLVSHRLILHGRWLKRSGGFPVYQTRFFHKKRLRFIDHGHGQREKTGLRIGTLRNSYLHFAFVGGMERWLSKHNRYAFEEAEQMLTSSENPRITDFFRGKVLRRRLIKKLTSGLPFRPFLRWFTVLFVQRGVLDGKPGVTYAKMLATYELMTELHRNELKHPNKLNANTRDQ